MIKKFLIELRLFIKEVLKNKDFFSNYNIFLSRMSSFKVISEIPHPVNIYESVLTSLSENKNFKFLSLESYCSKDNMITDLNKVVLRHDHDGGFIKPLLKLCEVEERLGLRSSVHVMIDGVLYRPEKLINLWKELNIRGFDVGLHTQSWIYEDCSSIFLDEIKKFEDLLGFSPKTFSQHGAWPRTKEDMLRRSKFIKGISNIIKGTSIVGYNNTYDVIVEDSAFKGEFRPLFENFQKIANITYPGNSVLILTHDGYQGKEYWS